MLILVLLLAQHSNISSILSIEKRLLTNVAPHPPCFSAVLFAKTIIQGYSFTLVYICKHFLFFAKFLLYYLKNLSFGASYYSSALFHSAMARISFKIEADQTFRKWTNGNNLDHKDNDVWRSLTNIFIWTGEKDNKDMSTRFWTDSR